MKNKIKNIISKLLIIAVMCSLVACKTPYKDEDILCEYDELNCLYYVKDEYKKYKYSDYIFDDISSGMYKKSTPNIADYRIGTGILDYDIEAYVKARMDYAIKMDLIDKYEMEIDKICAAVHEDYFEQRNSYVYFYDKGSKKSVLLHDGPVTNISYDDEVPTIMFDVSVEGENSKLQNIEGRRIMLSDIIAANSTIDGYMKVVLGTGKERQKFFLDKRAEEMELFSDIASISEIVK